MFIPAPAPSRPPAPSSVFTTKPVSRNPFAMRPSTLPSAWGAPSSSTAPLRPPPSKQSHADPDSREETFDLRSVSLENGDLDRVAPSEADKHMRELLEGVTNEFAGDGVGWEDGDEIVDGFREGIKLMPHQVRLSNLLLSSVLCSTVRLGALRPVVDVPDPLALPTDPGHQVDEVARVWSQDGRHPWRRHGSRQDGPESRTDRHWSAEEERGQGRLDGRDAHRVPAVRFPPFPFLALRDMWTDPRQLPSSGP